MKCLGLDLGSRTLGVAISDNLGIIARTYDTFRFNDDDYNSALNYVLDIVKKEKIDKIVLGYPKHMNGDIGIRGQISLDFKKMIKEKIDIEVILIDERLTTVSADRIMISQNVRREERKKKKDELAALIILQNYLDR